MEIELCVSLFLIGVPILMIIRNINKINVRNSFINNAIQTLGVIEQVQIVEDRTQAYEEYSTNTKRKTNIVDVSFKVNRVEYRGTCNYYGFFVYRGKKVKIYYDPIDPNKFIVGDTKSLIIINLLYIFPLATGIYMLLENINI